MVFEDRAYLNDHLLQEFRERVSKKRGIFLHSRISEALKKFAVKVSKEEVKEEDAIISAGPTASDWSGSFRATPKTTVLWEELMGRRNPSNQDETIRDMIERWISQDTNALTETAKKGKMIADQLKPTDPLPTAEKDQP
jgi:hypothetical protein